MPWSTALHLKPWLISLHPPSLPSERHGARSAVLRYVLPPMEVFFCSLSPPPFQTNMGIQQLPPHLPFNEFPPIYVTGQSHLWFHFIFMVSKTSLHFNAGCITAWALI